MANDNIIPILVIVGVIAAIVLGNQFGLFAVFQCQDPETGVFSGMNYITFNSCVAQIHDAKGTVSSNAGQSGSNFVLGSSVSSNDERVFATYAQVEFDADIKALNEVNILQSSTFTHTRHCGQVGRYFLYLKDDNNQLIEIGLFERAITVCDSGTASIGDVNIKISSDKKSVVTSIVGASSKTIDTSNLVGKWRLVIKQEVATTVKDSSYSISTTITNIERIGAIAQPITPSIPVPPKPVAKQTSSFLSQLQNSITSLFSIFGFFSVTGPASFTTGTPQTFSAERNVVIDNNKDDGTFTYQYANWILAKSDGTILTEGTWEEIPNGIYSKSFQVTLNEQGSYALVVLVQQFTLNYNSVTGQWSTISENLIFDDAPLKLEVAGTTTTTETGTTEPVVTSSPAPSTSSPSITTLQPEEIPEQKSIAVTKNLPLIVAAILAIVLLGYIIFKQD